MFIITESVVQIPLLIGKSFIRVVRCFRVVFVNLHGIYTVGLMSGLGRPKLRLILANLRVMSHYLHLICTFLSKVINLIFYSTTFHIIWCFSPFYRWSPLLIVLATLVIFSPFKCLKVFSSFWCEIS